MYGLFGMTTAIYCGTFLLTFFIFSCFSLWMLISDLYEGICVLRRGEGIEAALPALNRAGSVSQVLSTNALNTPPLSPLVPTKVGAKGLEGEKFHLE